MITPEERDYIGEVIAEDAALRDGRVEGVTAELGPSAEESINGWKLVPVEPTEEMLNVLHDRVLISVNTRKREANILNDNAWWAAVVDAAPAPPAGGEVESVSDLLRAYSLGEFENEGGSETVEAMSCKSYDDFGQDHDFDSYTHGYQQAMHEQGVLILAQVTRLQAESAALQQRLNVVDQQNDELTAENARLKEQSRSRLIGLSKCGVEREEAQSELTKAMELLGRVYDADLAARHHQPYNVSKVIDNIESFLAHQSAPAAVANCEHPRKHHEHGGTQLRCSDCGVSCGPAAKDGK